MSIFRDSGSSVCLTDEEIGQTIDDRMSRSSVERDVSMILNHSVDSKDSFLVDKKLNNSLRQTYEVKSDDDEIYGHQIAVE